MTSMRWPAVIRLYVICWTAAIKPEDLSLGEISFYWNKLLIEAEPWGRDAEEPCRVVRQIAGVLQYWGHWGLNAEGNGIPDVHTTLRQGDVVLDVGAHRGDFSRCVLEAFDAAPGLEGFDGRSPLMRKLVALEANPALAESLRRRMDAWTLHPNVTTVVWEAAVVPELKSGHPVPFYVWQSNEMAPLGTLLPKPDWPRLLYNEISVASVSIAEALGQDRALLLKLDCEGHDGNILAASIHLFAHEQVTFLIFEDSQEASGVGETLTALWNEGYVCFALGVADVMIPMFPDITEHANSLRKGTSINDFLCGHAWNQAVEALLETAWPVAIHGSLPRALLLQHFHRARLRVAASKRESSHPFSMKTLEASLSAFRNPYKFHEIKDRGAREHLVERALVLGAFYQDGNAWGMEQNVSKARHFFAYAASRGSLDAKFKLAWLQLFTHPRNPAAAWKSFREMRGKIITADVAMEHLSQPAIYPALCKDFATALETMSRDGQMWRCRGGNCIPPGPKGYLLPGVSGFCQELLLELLPQLLLLELLLELLLRLLLCWLPAAW